MIRVLVAEDMHLIRGALVALLDMEPDIEVVAQVSNGDRIVPAVVEHHPDVALLDVNMPGTDGLTAADQLRQVAPGCRVVILTALGQPGILRRALNARVSGFIPKDAPPDRLADSLRRVVHGQRAIDPQLALEAWEAVDNPLTPREAEVLRLAATGTAVADIARDLYLTPGTVRNYLTAAVTKTDARNRVDAIRIAQERGWICSAAVPAAEPVPAPAGGAGLSVRSGWVAATERRRGRRRVRR